MSRVTDKPIDKAQIKRRITIRNPRSVYRQKPRMFDILVADKGVYLEFRTNKTDSEVVKVNDVIELIREAAVEIEDFRPD